MQVLETQGGQLIHKTTIREIRHVDGDLPIELPQNRHMEVIRMLVSDDQRIRRKVASLHRWRWILNPGTKEGRPR